MSGHGLKVMVQKKIRWNATGFLRLGLAVETDRTRRFEIAEY